MLSMMGTHYHGGDRLDLPLHMPCVFQEYKESSWNVYLTETMAVSCYCRVCQRNCTEKHFRCPTQ